MGTALNQLQQLVEEDQQKKADAAGLNPAMDLWKESLPESGLPDSAASEAFMEAAEAENLAASGGLSVATGDTDDGAGTDTPAPGPDDEETPVGTPGDTSEGETDPEADPELEIEGLWKPPEGENIEPIPTSEMTSSPEWVENARIVYEALGKEFDSGDATRLQFGLPHEEEELDDEEVAEWASSEVAAFNWHVPTTISLARKIFSRDDPELAKAFLNLVNMYEYSDGGAGEGARAAAYLLADPTTYAGLGVGTIATKGATLGVAKAGFKKAAIKYMLTGAAGGATEGATLAGSFDLVKQNLEQEAGARENLDPWQTAKAMMFGTAAGATLGGGLGFLLGRFSDKLSAAAKNKNKNVGGQYNDAGTLKMATPDARFNSNKVDQSFISSEIDGMIAEGVTPQVTTLKPSEVLATQRWLRETDEMTDEDVQAMRGWMGAEADNFTDAEIREMNQVVSGDEPVFADYPDKPVVFKRLNGDTLIIDGHHRFNQAAVEGDLPIEAYVFSERPALGDVMPGQRGAVGSRRKGGKKKPPKGPEPTPHESEELLDATRELEEIERGEVRFKKPGESGSVVRTEDGRTFELLSRSNGWYKAIDTATGEEKNLRRKQFELTQPPVPKKSGTFSLSIYDDDTARIIKMADDVTHSARREHVTVSHEESQRLADELKELGVNIEARKVTDHWTPAQVLFLKNTYEGQGKGLMELSRRMNARLERGEKLSDEELAFFNQAHAKFIATRDLLRGVSSNAARMLNVLQSRPVNNVYDFTDNILQSIGMQGGRRNTERAIGALAAASKQRGFIGLTGASDQLDAATIGRWILNIRYNYMLSSWRTHFRNLVGNTASGVYEHFMVSPVRMTINNVVYAGQYAKSFIPGVEAPDPASRLTLQSWASELRGHVNAARDSLRLAKEIALGRDIGEGKVWNELGLRYNVINVPKTTAGKVLSTPVRALEAQDAFYKNQYYNSKIYALAERKARSEQVHHNMDFAERYEYWIDNPTPEMMREAKDWAAKLTYTSNPNIYGGVLAGLARAAQSLQSSHWIFNALLPFVKTPANLLGYSIDMIGVGHLPMFSKARKVLMEGTPYERQDLMARLTVAAGLWMYVADQYFEGNITGSGPQNWEERKAWEEAGWQQSSIRIGDTRIGLNDVQPAGSAINIIASIMDYITLADPEDGGMAMLGTGLLTMADIIKDDSYLSTITDMIVAIDSKEEGRARTIAASTIASYLVPNMLRDVRRVTDPVQRSMASDSWWDKALKLIQNATPGLSDRLPPSYDWKGDVKEYYGSAYVRGMVPFQLKDATKQDPASMALAYARIPISTPSQRIAMPGRDNFIDLLAMDEGRGYVYAKYQELMGKARHEAVMRLMETSTWKRLVKEDNIGPGSIGDEALRRALGAGSQVGRAQMLQFLQKNDEIVRGNGEVIPIIHPFDKREYIRYIRMIQRDGKPVPTEDIPQYDIRTPRKGVEFFAPRH